MKIGWQWKRYGKNYQVYFLLKFNNPSNTVPRHRKNVKFDTGCVTDYVFCEK